MKDGSKTERSGIEGSGTEGSKTEPSRTGELSFTGPFTFFKARLVDLTSQALAVEAAAVESAAVRAAEVDTAASAGADGGAGADTNAGSAAASNRCTGSAHGCGASRNVAQWIGTSSPDSVTSRCARTASSGFMWMSGQAG